MTDRERRIRELAQKFVQDNYVDRKYDYSPKFRAKVLAQKKKLREKEELF